jgi:hypothetical protein
VKNKKVTKWFEISEDELQHRMNKKAILKDEVCTKANEMVFAMLDNILKYLGMNVNTDDLTTQKEILGVHITTLEFYPGIFVIKDMVPFAWVSDARINHLGEIYCEAHMFELDTMWGLKIGKLPEVT